jgi:glyoxylase-like metal-dependent hydrolase (beta-lactamase superfamily II)
MKTSFEVGNTRIDRIVEQEEPFFDPLHFFPKLTKETLEANRSWLEPRYHDPKSGKMILCIQSYLVRTPHHTILVDSCVGNHKERPTRPFWHQMQSDRYEQNLKAAGVGLGDIDYVMCTHLHTDHVGWNTRLENGRWVPTFPKARYVFADRELAHWTERHAKDPSAFPWITDSVLPIVAANRVDVVKSAYAFNDLVELIPTPGHTFDHYSVKVGKSGADAVITGDMVHSPLQMKYPELGMMADWDSEEAGRSRRRLFGQLCDTSTLLCTAHFPSPSTGRVGRDGDAFRFVDL